MKTESKEQINVFIVYMNGNLINCVPNGTVCPVCNGKGELYSEELGLYGKCGHCNIGQTAR